MKRVLKIVGVLVLAFIAFIGAVLVEAHIEIRGVDPPVPELAELRKSIAVADGPRRIHFLNTATQAAPDGVIGHPAFVLEWTDGRIFLIDAGMDEAGALAFGAALETMVGADPIEPLGSVASRIGAEALARVRGIAFTHLHVDHTGGVVPLCEALGRALPVYQTSWQTDRGNYSTSGNDHLEQASCAQRHRLEDVTTSEISGFPGLVAVAAGGHTPGSTVFVARLGKVTWVLAGDVTNSMAALLANKPKPTIYSLLIVPESPARLERMRLWLAALDAEPDVTVLVSHDQRALEASGMRAWVAK